MSVRFNFKGKVALISGSSSGIGAAIALLFSRVGADVVVTGRKAATLAEVAKKCREASNNDTKVLEVVADVNQEEDLKRIVNETIKTFGRLDILVNNAGIGIKGRISDPDFLDKYNLVLQTNLNSVVLLSYLSIDHLKKTKGNIINISSIAALRSGISFSPYHVVMAGLDMFTKCLAGELGPDGIRVHIINCGSFKTAFKTTIGLSQADTARITKDFTDHLPLRRIGDGYDIANAVLFLASDVASYITGSNLVIDGGNLAANLEF